MATTPTELRDGYADLGEVRLHYVEAGEGPLVVLLHGFPEYWAGWRQQIPALAGRGFRVVAPDMRGYNLSSKPKGVAAYDIEVLAGDVAGLIRERGGGERALLAGHDWGAAVAYATAMFHPEAVERLAILNVPHPRRMLEGLRTPRQLAKSWYMFAFQLNGVAERLARRENWRYFRRAFEEDARPGAFTPQDVAGYVETWEKPGAMTAMMSYYRAALRASPRKSLARLRPISAPTLVIWGERDRYLGSELAEPHRSDVPALEGVIRVPSASHWVQHDEPELVTGLLARFFGEDRPG
jgi:pimeloyl-ACP methyl ester carboxylesterase